MIESFLFGVGGKLITNLINAWLKKGTDRERNEVLRHQSPEWIQAQIQLQKEINSDVSSRICRAAIYFSVTLTFCFITIYSMIYPIETDILMQNRPGFFGYLFGSTKETIRKAHSTGLVFQSCLDIMSAVIGAFVTRGYGKN